MQRPTRASSSHLRRGEFEKSRCFGLARGSIPQKRHFIYLEEEEEKVRVHLEGLTWWYTTPTSQLLIIAVSESGSATWI